MSRYAIPALLIVATVAMADAYAPLANVDRAKKMSHNPMAMQLSQATAPDAGTVGIAAYPGAEIVLINEFAHIREGRYQEIKLLRLYSGDSIDTVMARLKADNPDWVWRDAEHMRSQMYPVQGASSKSDLPGNSGQLVSGPRVSLADIDRENHPLAAEIKQFSEMAPGSRTEIRIEYPGATVDLIRVDESVIDNGTRRCIEQESKRFQKTMGSQFPVNMPTDQRQQILAQQAGQHCSILQQACSANPNKVACQRLLRLYEN